MASLVRAEDRAWSRAEGKIEALLAIPQPATSIPRQRASGSLRTRSGPARLLDRPRGDGFDARRRARRCMTDRPPDAMLDASTGAVSQYTRRRP
jgi:hypothetical protein